MLVIKQIQGLISFLVVRKPNFSGRKTQLALKESQLLVVRKPNFKIDLVGKPNFIGYDFETPPLMRR
jgi:hypothetical protein